MPRERDKPRLFYRRTVLEYLLAVYNVHVKDLGQRAPSLSRSIIGEPRSAWGPVLCLPGARAVRRLVSLFPEIYLSFPLLSLSLSLRYKPLSPGRRLASFPVTDQGERTRWIIPAITSIHRQSGIDFLDSRFYHSCVYG